MKRLFSLVLLLLCSLPVGVSISGCGINASNYCPGGSFIRTSQVYSIILQPISSTVSLAYAQEQALATPQAENCNGTTVGAGTYSYGTTNTNLVDVSPSGALCAGTWNRNSGGGVPNYTICSPPSNATLCGLLGKAATCDPTQGSPSAYGSFYADITASAGGVTSNAVRVFVHPVVTSVFSFQVPTSNTACNTSATCGTSSNTVVPACLSQGSQINYCSLVCNGATNITAAVGNIIYGSNNPNIVTFAAETTVNQQYSTASAQQPGSTIVTATISGVSSNGGYFSTCPPAALNINANGTDSVSVAPNNIQQISLGTDSKHQQIFDTRGVAFTSLTGLTYTSTNPSTLGVTSAGVISPTYASNGDVYAACLPPGCNPSEISQIAQPAPSNTPNPDLQTGNGLPIISNPIRVNAPGSVSSILYMVSFSTPYVSLYNSNGTVAAQPFQLPYTPNSAVISQDGTHIYFGSSTELMAVATSNNQIVLQNRTVPGKVLAISPDGTALFIYDPVGNTIYIVNSATGAISNPHSGPALSAKYTPDNDTIYFATGKDYAIEYNKFTGWSTTPVPSGTSDVAVVTPPVGAFFAGSTTTALGYCPNVVVSPPVYFPIAADVSAITSVLTSSNDGNHVFGANDNAGLIFSDIATTVPSGADGLCPLANTGLTIPTTLTQYPAPSIAGDTLTAVDSASSTFNISSGTPNTTYTAFVTYTTPGTPTTPASLPVYQTTSGIPGSSQFALIPLASTGTSVPTAPTAGVVSPDNKIFFVTTSGDNLLHFINIPQPSATAPPTSLPSDNGAPISTKLFKLDGTPLPADVVLIRPYLTGS